MKLVLNTLIALFIFVASAQNNTSYWQQKADYKMEIDMDVENHQYKGTQELTYTNNSPDTLYRVFYHFTLTHFSQIVKWMFAREQLKTQVIRF